MQTDLLHLSTPVLKHLVPAVAKEQRFQKALSHLRAYVLLTFNKYNFYPKHWEKLLV